MCHKCGFVFTQNPFTEEQLANRYKNFSKFEYDADDYILDDDYANRCVRQRHFIEESINLADVESLLEVGAASGYNLSIYKGNRRVLGIEPSDKNCQLAKKNYDVDMFSGTMKEYLDKGKKDKFDLIFLSMVLEHIVNPMEFISSVASLCNRYVFIEVPCLDIRCEEEPFGIFCEEHVNIFTLDSLNKLMNVNGFKLINVENIYGLNSFLPAGFPAVVTLWEKTKNIIPTFRYNLFSSEEMLDIYIRESKKGLEVVNKKIDSIPNDIRLAVWGIGHHASMLLANTALRDKNIIRAYDSDKRKEGMKFAGCDILPFREEKEVDAILLTTYTAQKSIERYTRKMGVKSKIFTLYDI